MISSPPSSCSQQFTIKDQIVLELGAGAGLPGIISVLNGAKEVVLSDYPAPEILQNIEHNLKLNLPPTLLQKATVKGHLWGEIIPTTTIITSSSCPNQKLTNNHDTLLSPSTYSHKFTRIIVADCMWMSWQHENLCKSIIHFLDPKQGQVLAIAGFHTGRAKVAEFFEWCGKYGLVGEIVERDVEGMEREWVVDRGVEDVVERKRWLTIGRFRMEGGEVGNGI